MNLLRSSAKYLSVKVDTITAVVTAVKVDSHLPSGRKHSYRKREKIPKIKACSGPIWSVMTIFGRFCRKNLEMSWERGKFARYNPVAVKTCEATRAGLKSIKNEKDIGRTGFID